jgi:hypothetical protein
MKTYIIPEKNRLERMLIMDMAPPLPRVIQRLENSPFYFSDPSMPINTEPLPIKEFVLETVTDIAVYREKVQDDEAIHPLPSYRWGSGCSG